MNHYASPSFWECYNNLPVNAQELADKNYQLLKPDPNHPSLHFKKIHKYFSVRVGIRYRALGIAIGEGIFVVLDWKSC